MSRRKGTPKSGGRQAGTPNAVTRELRERIKIFLEGNFETIEKDFMILTSDRRVVLFEKYLKFVLPQLQSGSFDLNLDRMSDEEITQLLNRIVKNNTSDKKNL